MTMVSIAPDSPPDLSGSKSSKSSSFRSSQLSSPDGFLADISNFEDIGLHEELGTHYMEHRQFEQDNVCLRSGLRRSSRIGGIRNVPMTTTRDLTSFTTRGEYPQVLRHVNTTPDTVQSLNPSQSSISFRRSSTAPSTPT